MEKTAELKLDGKTCKFAVVEGTEQERAIDISKLRDETGFITLDDGYANTGSCKSRITFIDGEKGILRYRGIPIEEARRLLPRAVPHHDAAGNAANACRIVAAFATSNYEQLRGASPAVMPTARPLPHCSGSPG